MNTTVSLNDLLYDGLSDPRTFQYHFNLQVVYQTWDEARQLVTLPAHLIGKAKRAWDALTNTEKASIGTAMPALIKALDKPKDTLLSMFFAEKRRDDEPLSKFAWRLQEMLLKAMPDLSPDQSAQMLRGQILNHLPEHMRALIVFSPTMSWDALLVALDKAMPHVAAHARLTASAGPSPATDVAPLIKTEPIIDTNFASSTSNTSNERQQHAHCGQDCRMHQETNQHRRSNNNQHQRSQRFDGECSYCRNYGHKSADCRKRKREIAQNQLHKFSSQRGTYMSDNKNNSTANSNNVQAGADTSDADFPYYGASYNIYSAIVSAAATSNAGAELLKVTTRLALFDTESQLVTALVDGGSSHSFISPSVLTAAHRAIVSDPERCARAQFVISGVTGDAKSTCNLVDATIGIGDWEGAHNFVISGTITKHQMILGRDFLKRNNAVIDHANNIMQVGNFRLCVNAIDSSVQPLAAITNTTIVANQKQVFEEIASLRVELAKFTKSTTSATVTIAEQVAPPPPHEHTCSASSLAIDAICLAVCDTIIAPRSQRLVEFASPLHLHCNTVMLEPLRKHPSPILVARSVHTPSTGFFCSVLNPTDEQVIIAANTELGRLSEAEEANVKFESDVLAYEPLVVNELKRRAEAPLALAHDVAERLASLRISDKLSESQRSQLQLLISQRISTFQWNKHETGRTKLVEHCIPTGNNAPIQQRQYPIPQIAREPLTAQVDDMLSKGIIRPSSSSWRSPVLLVKKKSPDGSVQYRFCIDLKRVNGITTKDSYSLPLIHRSVDALSGAKFFSTFDVDRAFWQIGVKEEDKKKLAFVVDSKLFEFNVMPFGSMNAPSTFQRLIDRVLHGLTWRQCLVYIDDVLIFSPTFDDHLAHLDEVLARFEFAGLKLKPSKCFLAND